MIAVASARPDVSLRRFMTRSAVLAATATALVVGPGLTGPASADAPIVSISCDGNVVTGTVTLPGASSPVTGVSLYVDPVGGAPAYVPTTESQKLSVPAGTSKTFSLDASGFNAQSYKVNATQSNGSTTPSNPVADSSCAPAPVVAEAASAVALPASLLLSAAGVYLVVSRRRRRSAAEA